MVTPLRTLEELKPPPPPICDWIESNIINPPGNSKPGPLKLFSYQKQILEAYTDTNVREIVLMMSSQVGKTLLATLMLLYSITNDPTSMMATFPRRDDIQSWRKNKLQPMFDVNPNIPVPQPYSRDGENNVNRLSFPRGYLELCSTGGVGSSIRSRTAQVVIADEIDLYEKQADADNPVDVLRQRQTTYDGTNKMVLISTPIMKGKSRIEEAYNDGTQNRLWVVHPTCDSYQQFTWEGNVVNGVFVCATCFEPIDEPTRTAMVEAGTWWADNEAADSSKQSFHLNQFYSGLVTADSTIGRYNPDDKKSFFQQVLAIPYSTGSITDINEDDLTDHYHSTAPYSGKLELRTMGVDVQANRLEYVILDWYQGERVFCSEYGVIPKNVSKDNSEWEALKRVILNRNVKRTFIDRGYKPDDVVNGINDKMATLLKGKRVFTCRGIGRSSFREPLAKATKDYFWIATDEAKVCIMESLQAGHWYGSDTLPKSYLPGLLSERLDETNKWIVKPGRRNEVLDCAVYAFAARRSLPGYGKKQVAEIQEAVNNLI